LHQVANARPGLIDAELFGNIAGYPNPGMPERQGVIGRGRRLDAVPRRDR